MVIIDRKNSIALQKKVIELQRKGISISIDPICSTTGEIIFNLEVAASELLPDTEIPVMKYQDYERKPKRTTDYLLAWLNMIFPYLSAPLFKAQWKEILVPILEKTIIKKQFVKETPVIIVEQLPYLPLYNDF